MRNQGQVALVLAQEIGHSKGLSLGHRLIGGAALAEKRYSEAQQWLQEGLAFRINEASYLIHLGDIAAIAETLPPEVLTAARERGQKRDLWVTMEGLLVELDTLLLK
jgi:hypothetical protein